MDLKQIMINMSMLGLFVFSIFAFIIIAQSDNNIPDEYSIINDSRVSRSYANLSSELSQSNTKAETSSNVFGNITPTEEYGEISVRNVISMTSTVKNIVTGVWNSLIFLPMAVLGVSSMVASIITAILIVTIIIGIWAVWKGVVS